MAARRRPPVIFRNVRPFFCLGLLFLSPPTRQATGDGAHTDPSATEPVVRSAPKPPPPQTPCRGGRDAPATPVSTSTREPAAHRGGRPSAAATPMMDSDRGGRRPRSKRGRQPAHGARAPAPATVAVACRPPLALPPSGTRMGSSRGRSATPRCQTECSVGATTRPHGCGGGNRAESCRVHRQGRGPSRREPPATGAATARRPDQHPRGRGGRPTTQCGVPALVGGRRGRVGGTGGGRSRPNALTRRSELMRGVRTLRPAAAFPPSTRRRAATHPAALCAVCRARARVRQGHGTVQSCERPPPH